MSDSIESLLEAALAARKELLDARYESALRLFNGFYEGEPALSVDLYGRTLLLHDHADANGDVATNEKRLRHAQSFFLEKLPGIQTVWLKARRGDEQQRRGTLRCGERKQLVKRIREYDVLYAISLELNQDASLYLDTRNLRRWALDHLRDKVVLNTFAYTGSLGVAAAAAGARRVVQLDRNRAFLNVAKDSYALNGLPVVRADFRTGDFWEQTSHLRRSGALFDCVFVDPPFFSATAGGTVDLLAEGSRVLNKVRPLIGDGGWLVAVNNALFLSGADYVRSLEALCADGYLSLERTVPIPLDFTGTAETRRREPPADPAPFNHPTKIALLRARRKDGRTARDSSTAQQP